MEQLESAHLAIANRDTRAAPPEFIPGAPGAGSATTGPDQATLTRAFQSTDWLVHTHDYSGTRFSPLQEINATTAARLAPACLFQIGERDNFQTGPIVYNGTMYVTTTASTVALDAATCRVKWRSAPQVMRPRSRVAVPIAASPRFEPSVWRFTRPKRSRWVRTRGTTCRKSSVRSVAN